MGKRRREVCESMKEFRPLRKRTIASLALLLLLLALLTAAAVRAYALLNTVLDGRQAHSRTDGSLSYFQLREQMFSAQADTRVSGWLSLVRMEECRIGEGGDLRCGTRYWPVEANADAPWAIVLHGGFGTDRQQVTDIACMLSLAGYHVLTPDLYAYGQSAGSVSSLGLVDAADIERWVRWILEEDPDPDIVLYGIDEGAAACLLAGRALPQIIRAVAVDSVYTSVEDRAYQLAQEAGDLFSRFDRVLFSAAFRAVHGISLGDGDLIEAAKDYPLPLLVIHGTGDKDVPAWHGEDIAAAAGENAQLYFAEGAGHGMARFLEPQMYRKMLLGFYDSALK